MPTLTKILKWGSGIMICPCDIEFFNNIPSKLNDNKIFVNVFVKKTNRHVRNSLRKCIIFF